MVTLMDWLVQLEKSRSSLTGTRQERLAQLAYSQQKVSKQRKTSGRKSAAQAVTPVRCCPERIA